MAESSEADRYLMDQIALGDTDAWSQLVNRYHGRLLVFARSRMQRAADAEDLVQETFLRFLQSFRTFRPGASVETYLFTILRRRMIDHFRGRPLATCAIGDSSTPVTGSDAAMQSSPHSPSWYVRRDEQTELLEEAIAAGLSGMISRLRDQQKLDELRVIEMVIHAQMRNKDIAALCKVDEKQVAQIKFRALDQVRQHLGSNLNARQADALGQMRWEDAESSDSVLTRVWESLRPTCPKRSTIGRLLLGTLDSPWSQYVEFHIHQLGCRFCQANLEDLRRESLSEPAPQRQQVFQSTVGFLSTVARERR